MYVPVQNVRAAKVMGQPRRRRQDGALVAAALLVRVQVEDVLLVLHL
jgi:hypothetical protein